jgi:hypothetical protein
MIQPSLSRLMNDYNGRFPVITCLARDLYLVIPLKTKHLHFHALKKTRKQFEIYCTVSGKRVTK